MDLEEFRKYGHEIVDWIADYYTNIKSLPVLSKVKPGEVARQLPESPPDDGQDMENILKDFRKIIIPGMTHWQHPSYFAYFPANTSSPSVLGEMLTAALGAQCMIWQTSPAAAELEEVVMDWLKQMLALPSSFTGVIQDTASTATLAALICARERATEELVNSAGFRGDKDIPRLAVYTSAEAHSSIMKGAKIAGFGSENVRLIGVDNSFAMQPEKLDQEIKRDIARGIKPCCVVAAVGTTSSLALDPVRAIGEVCQRHKVWLHVDAAMAGSAAILPECKSILDGIEAADSFVFNPHKWLFTNFDCSAYFCRDPKQLVRTFSINPEYLKTDVDMQVKNYRDWGIPLGRRFRALKLWFVIRTYGVKGLQDKLRTHIALAKEFAEWAESDTRFELLAPVNLNLVCFRYNPPERNFTEDELAEINKSLMDQLNQSGKLYLTHTRLGGKFSLRLCVGQTNTTAKEVREAWEAITGSPVLA